MDIKSIAKKIRVLGSGCFLLGLSYSAGAATIEITQIFHDTNIVAQVSGVEQVITGDWIFKGTSDTTAVDNAPGLSTQGYYNASVTLTQASLGLVDAVITNIDSLFVISDPNATYQGLVGFSQGPGFTPWTRTEGTFSNPNVFPTVSELTITQFTSIYNTLGVFTSGYQLEDGTFISGFSSIDDLSSSMSAQIVPIPSALYLFVSGLFGLIGLASHKKARQN